MAAPTRALNREIQAVVEKKGDWILAKLNENPKDLYPLRFESGDIIPVLGQDLLLAVEESRVRKPGVRREDDLVRVSMAPGLSAKEKKSFVKGVLVEWYKVQAELFLERAVRMWVPRMRHSKRPRVLVRDQRSRWGSCSSDGTLRFSWRLAMLEPDLIESVVVHELAHLEVMNHSKAFWDVVERAMPDNRVRRKRLNEAGRHLPL